MNVYAGIPDNITEIIQTAATKALENEIKLAIAKLHDGQNGRFEAVIAVLKAMIGEDEKGGQ